MAGSDDSTLIKIAVFGLAMSFVCTAMVTILLSTETNGDYSFDEVTAYREQLSEFTGESMLNQTPWILQHVYTPWTPDLGTEGHVTDDNWLYGTEVAYDDIGKSAGIKLDPEQKSSIILGVDQRTYDYIVAQYEQGKNIPGWDYLAWLIDHIKVMPGQINKSQYVEQGWLDLAEVLGYTETVTEVGQAHLYNYTGYRYVFDPTKPFASDTATVSDGALSIVWYSYNGQEGISGALDVYGGDVLLASYSATDIINGYSSGSGYATHYDFNFNGTMLSLYVDFDQSAIESGISLMEAWTTGQWSMAISSTSVGNFLDINNSSAYTSTGGSMVQTFIQIYTLSLPSINNEWMDIILWLLVGLPMTLALALITLRIMGSVKII